MKSFSGRQGVAGSCVRKGAALLILKLTRLVFLCACCWQAMTSTAGEVPRTCFHGSFGTWIKVISEFNRDVCRISPFTSVPTISTHVLLILQAAMVSSWQKCGPILIRPPKAKVFYFDCAWWFIGLWLSCSFNFPSFRQIPECQPIFSLQLCRLLHH